MPGPVRSSQDGKDKTRVYLSPPHLEGNEGGALQAVLESGWVAPAGPALESFEQEFCRITGVRHAIALTSCTAAIHLALLVVGVQRGDEVLCSSFTFTASANPIRMVGAEPVFIDSERSSWNMDPALLEEAILARIRATGRPPKALILVHIFGQSADLDPIVDLCERHGVILIEDAAEALGAVYRSRVRGEIAPGTIGRVGTFSFNGNKIITSSGGGMLVTQDPELAARALFLATQARDPAPHYQHSTLGFNYRLSNVLAALGHAQLPHLGRRVEARRAIFERYLAGLGSLPGISFMPEPAWSRSTHWLTCLTIDAAAFGASRDEVCRALAAENIEARPVWKPLHLQPLFADCPSFGGAVSETIFRNGICLPSGSNLPPADLERVLRIIRRTGGHSS
jgi:pyridoxal phosphate-dependent aminotransferase EpsN